MDSFTDTITFIIGILIVIFGFFITIGGIYAIVIWYPRRVSKRVAALKASGKQGEATILNFPPFKKYSHRAKAMFILISIRLKIWVSGIELYEIEKTFKIPPGYVHLLEIGKIVPVWIGPNNPRDLSKIVIHIE